MAGDRTSETSIDGYGGGGSFGRRENNNNKGGKGIEFEKKRVSDYKVPSSRLANGFGNPKRENEQGECLKLTVRSS